MVRTPSYRLHKASGKAVVTLRGKDHYLGEFGSSESKRLYRRLLSEYLASDGRGVQQANESYSISELLAAFLKFAKKHYGTAANSKFTQYGILAKRVRRLYGPTPASQFGAMQFKAVRNELILEKLSRNYINETMGRLIRIFRWASSEELVSPSIGQLLRDIEPLRRGRTAARETDKVLPVDDSLVEATLPFLPLVVRHMVQFQRLVGCRPAEVCAITPSLVDRSRDVWEINLVKHKNAWRGQPRVIFVGPKAQKILAPYLLRDGESFCFSPAESERKRRQKAHEERETPMTCGNKPGSKKKLRRQGKIPPRVGSMPGRQYDRTSYARCVKRACEKAFPFPEGIGEKEKSDWIKRHHWSPNRLRHTFGTEIRKQFGLDSAQAMLGHSSIETSEIYSELDAEKARVAARRIG